MTPSDEFMAEFNRLKDDGGSAHLLKQLFPQLWTEHQRTREERDKLLRRNSNMVKAFEGVQKISAMAIKTLGD